MVFLLLRIDENMYLESGVNLAKSETETCFPQAWLMRHFMKHRTHWDRLMARQQTIVTFRPLICHPTSSSPSITEGYKLAATLIQTKNTRLLLLS